MADRLLLSNETWLGYAQDEEVFTFSLVRTSSALTGSAIDVFVAGPMKANGRIVDFIIGTDGLGVSASGFTASSISATVKVNSVAALSTNPSIPGPAGSAAAMVHVATNMTFTSAAGKPSPISAVVNSASANFSVGDVLTIDYDLNSVGGAAAGSGATGSAGHGFYATVKVRYAVV